jgi:hypothetical protein
VKGGSGHTVAGGQAAQAAPKELAHVDRIARGQVVEIVVHAVYLRIRTQILA